MILLREQSAGLWAIKNTSSKEKSFSPNYLKYTCHSPILNSQRTWAVLGLYGRYLSISVCQSCWNDMGKEVAHEGAQLRTLHLLSNFLLSSPARARNWRASLPSPQSIYTQGYTQKNACMAGFKERIPSEQLSSLSPWVQVTSKETAFLYVIHAELCHARFLFKL